MTRTVPPSLTVSGKKGHKWADCRKRLAEAKDKKVHAVGAPSSATVSAVEDTGEIDESGICGSWSDDDDSRVDTSEVWVLSVEGDNMPADAEFLPLDSACEEHICPWNFAEGGFGLGLSRVQLGNANDFFRKESDGVMRRRGPRRTRDTARSNSFSCRPTSKGLFSVCESSRRAARRSSSVARAQGLIFTPTVGCNACLCG